MDTDSSFCKDFSVLVKRKWKGVKWELVVRINSSGAIVGQVVYECPWSMPVLNLAAISNLE